MKTTSQNDSCTFLLNNIATYPYNPTVDSIFFTLTPQYGQDTVVSVSSDLIFTDSILCISDFTTLVQNIDKPNKQNQLLIYPNPIITNEVTFTYNVSPEAGIISIYNIEGKEVAHYSLPQWSSVQHLKLPELSSGIYLARFLSGDFSATVKFVKE